MKYYSQIEAIEFFKLASNSNISFLLDQGHTVTFVDNTKYQFIIKGPQVNIESKVYSNYTKLIDDCTVLLNKYSLVKRLKANTISISSEVTEIGDGATSFSFDSLINGTTTPNLNVEKLTESDIENIILNDNLEKGWVKDGVLTLVMKQGTTYQREYNRLNVINLLVKYIEVLVENKKKQNTLVINNTISIYFETKAQNLVIREGDQQEQQVSEGYIDNNLINSSFVLCSLSDLVIDKTKLKIWLNKVIVNSEKLSKIYFN